MYVFVQCEQCIVQGRFYQLPAKIIARRKQLNAQSIGLNFAPESALHSVELSVLSLLLENLIDTCNNKYRTCVCQCENWLKYIYRNYTRIVYKRKSVHLNSLT